MSSIETDETGPAEAEDCDHSGTRPGARFCPKCGAKLSGQAAEPEPDDDGPRRWWHRESEARWARSPIRIPARLVVPIAIGAAVIIAAVTVLYFVQSRWFEPEAAANELGAALEAGDGPAVADILGVNVEDHPMLAPGALDAGFEPITDFEVTDVEHKVSGEWVTRIGGDGIAGVSYVEDHTKRPDRENARITISYRLDGEEVTAELHATREASGWFRSWSINPAVIETTVGAYATADVPIQLAALSVTQPEPAEDDGYAAEPTGLLALPGVYTATAPGDTLWAEATGTVAVALGAEEWAVASAELRPEAAKDATARVHSHIDECASTPGYPDTLCGFRDDSGWMLTMPSDAAWELHEYPEVEITPDYTGGLEVRTLTPGSASATYTTGIGTERTIQVDIETQGYAYAEGDSIVFEPYSCDLDAGIC